TELRERALDEHRRAFREREVEPVALRLRPESIARAFAPIADEAHLLLEPANGVLLCELEPVILRLRRRDRCDRADLGPGELAAGEGLVDGRGLVEVARDRDQPLRLLLGNAELDLGPMSRASKSGTEERAALHVLEVERERAAVNVGLAEMVEAASDELISRKPQDDFDLLFHVESPLLDSLPSRPGGLSGPQSSKSMQKMNYSHFFSAPRGIATLGFLLFLLRPHNTLDQAPGERPLRKPRRGARRAATGARPKATLAQGAPPRRNVRVNAHAALRAPARARKPSRHSSAPRATTESSRRQRR